ncbi:D-ribitol-5-phosphate cytidylyltransferase-like [Sycon ciliatum]|uniref:D-ribitol-5-phosphate cytidylyltransferase-like n=1 Tax=Sycon ciliatum TaxID=27933 RepID=UPI0031F6409A
MDDDIAVTHHASADSAAADSAPAPDNVLPMPKMGPVAVVLPASGIGERSGREIPKQFVEVHDCPLVCHTISAFHRIPYIECIVVTVRREWKDFLLKRITRYGFHKVMVVEGDERSRHYSIRNGVATLTDPELIHMEFEVVVVHDAVRPFVCESVLCEVIAKAQHGGAAGVVVPCASTIVLINDDNLLEETLVRSKCRNSEMPQAFRLKQFHSAYQQASDDTMLHGTECLQIYRHGNPEDRIALVTAAPGLHWKVTYAGDFDRVSALLSNRTINNSSSKGSSSNSSSSSDGTTLV